ncbi:hypothetical protein ACQEVZ_60770 [Dactylosporangium sp. CA-152071]|uniref:hypothetical protein n=1 Tax=Dactylosporangium sp. CA-152071 TaxID=3239933 RepID=UPI003D90DE0C
MKQRLSLSVDQETAAYLDRRAQTETSGNVSALVERLVRQARLADALQAEAAWYADRPDYAEDAEAERYAA